MLHHLIYRWLAHVLCSRILMVAVSHGYGLMVTFLAKAKECCCYILHRRHLNDAAPSHLDGWLMYCVVERLRSSWLRSSWLRSSWLQSLMVTVSWLRSLKVGYGLSWLRSYGYGLMVTFLAKAKECCYCTGVT